MWHLNILLLKSNRKLQFYMWILGVIYHWKYVYHELKSKTHLCNCAATSREKRFEKWSTQTLIKNEHIDFFSFSCLGSIRQDEKWSFHRWLRFTVSEGRYTYHWLESSSAFWNRTGFFLCVLFPFCMER